MELRGAAAPPGTAAAGSGVSFPVDQPALAAPDLQQSQQQDSYKALPAHPKCKLRDMSLWFILFLQGSQPHTHLRVLLPPPVPPTAGVRLPPGTAGVMSHSSSVDLREEWINRFLSGLVPIGVVAS